MVHTYDNHTSNSIQVSTILEKYTEYNFKIFTKNSHQISTSYLSGSQRTRANKPEFPLFVMSLWNPSNFLDGDMVTITSFPVSNDEIGGTGLTITEFKVQAFMQGGENDANNPDDMDITRHQPNFVIQDIIDGINSAERQYDIKLTSRVVDDPRYFAFRLYLKNSDNVLSVTSWLQGRNR